MVRFGLAAVRQEAAMIPTKAKAISIDGENYIAEASLNS